ncbi:MAG: hypothetical protein HOC52_06865, partial [Thiotrichales bacterium]|nr:hypothetical protein [Thiotrichales bacterium]
PKTVIQQAQQKLVALEQEQADAPTPASTNTADPVQQMSLFATSAVEESLRTIDPDELTPREALNALYQLKTQLV